LIIKMLLASLQPKEVEDETAKNVKRLFDVGEALHGTLGPGGGGHLLSRRQFHQAMNGQKKVMSLGTPYFC
jgi:hypothetical protein